MHHEWTAPVSVTGLYCHPIEFVFSNILPPVLSMVFICTHLSTAWLMFTLALMNVLNTHSGYHFPGFPSPEAHDYHHMKFTECFGVLGILDYLHGTNRIFRASPNCKRNITSLSLEPLRSQFPDEPNKEGKITQWSTRELWSIFTVLLPASSLYTLVRVASHIDMAFRSSISPPPPTMWNICGKTILFLSKQLLCIYLFRLLPCL